MPELKARYTASPWRVGDDDDNGQAIVRNEHIEVCTCWHHCVGGIEKEMRANACLIAAAPDLYEALAAIDAIWSDDGEGGRVGPTQAKDPRYRKMWTAARAALSRARGEDTDA